MASLKAHLCERLKIILTLKLQNLTFYRLTAQFILAIRDFDFYAYFIKNPSNPFIVIDTHNWLSLSQINDSDPLIRAHPFLMSVNKEVPTNRKLWLRTLTF